MKTFKKLAFDGTCFRINNRKSFTNVHEFKPETINKVFDFAYNMTFGGKGEHRDHRSNGKKERSPGEIFSNTFQGKLAECAVFNFLYTLDSDIQLDFNEKELGYWDQGDVDVCGKKIAVKSTKSYGNLLLLECADWNEKAEYIPNIESDNYTYDYFIMVRIGPSCDDIMKRNKCLYSKFCDRKNLLELLKKQIWKYEISGYITHSDFKNIIDARMIIKQGSYLNSTKTKMDADNYYVQLGDLRNPSELLNELKLLKEKKNANL